MTTAQSPTAALRALAEKIAKAVKLCEAGDRRIFKCGIVMDDKAIVLELPFEQIEQATEAELAEVILARMQEPAT